jgi:phosphotransferase system enzyme I (PtsI)
MMEKSDEIHIQGIPISEGIAIGIVHFPQVHEENEIPKIAITADQVDREIERYRKAIALSREDLEHLECSLNGEGLREAAKIIKAHLEMLSDPFLTVEMEGKVRNEKYNIESVFRTTMQEFALKFPKKADTFFQQRLVDVMDVSNRILGHLRRSPKKHFHDVPAGSIVIASDLDASSAASVQAKQISGFITSGGATGSHAALIARSRGIPYIGKVDLAPFLKHIGKTAIVDGQKGIVILNPKMGTLENYKKRQIEIWMAGKIDAAIPQLRCETYEGHAISLMANISSLDEIDQLHEIKADGVGLLRSEFLFTDPQCAVFEEQIQYQIFSQAIAKMKGAPIVIRLFDFGGDKQLPGYNLPFSERNPLMGCRGIRYLFRHQAFLRNHLRALLRAAKEGVVRLLVPLVSQVDEMKSIRKIFLEISDELERDHIPHCKDLKIGCMLEVPSALLLISELAPHCDFFSLGTNDLTQYVLGIDRINPILEALYQPLHPSVLRLMHWAIKEARRVQRPISVCGEIASQPLVTPLLLGLGLEELSVVPRSLLNVKKQIRTCSIIEAYKLAREALALEDADQVFQLCWKFAEKLS